MDDDDDERAKEKKNEAEMNLTTRWRRYYCWEELYLLKLKWGWSYNTAVNINMKKNYENFHHLKKVY